jgi:hypothetical protein
MLPSRAFAELKNTADIVWTTARDREVNQTVEVPRTIPEIACEFLSAFGSSGVISKHCHLVLGFGQ